MANPLYANYGPRDFDKFDCLKLSLVLYAMLAFLLRGYLVWLMSVTNMRDRVSILQLAYPQTSLFYLSLFAGAIGLFVVLLICLRKPNGPAWVKKCWPYTRLLLIGALLFDLSVNLVGYFYWQLQSTEWLMAEVGIIVLLIGLAYRNQRFSINLIEFPTPLEKPTKTK